MTSYFYVRRCKHKNGSSAYARVHAATNKGTLCGCVDIDDGRWFAYYQKPECGVTCPDCRREIKRQEQKTKNLRPSNDRNALP